MQRYTIPVAGKQLEIYRFRYEPVDSNMWFIPIDDTGVVFDPNINEELLLLFREYGIRKIQIVLTHEHYDHTTGVKWLQENIKTSLYCQEDCGKAIASGKGNSPKLVAMALHTKDLKDGGHRYEDFRKTYAPYVLNSDKTFEKDDKLDIEGLSIACHSTPGHSPGSTCYILDGKYIFTGDSLIQDAPTILSFRTSNREDYELITLPWLKALDKNMMVFPGHGEPFMIENAKYL